LNRFVYGRRKPEDIDNTFAKPTWANPGYRDKMRKSNGKYRGVYIKKNEMIQEQNLNKSENCNTHKRSASAVKPAKPLPKEILDKIAKNRKAL